MAWLSFESVVFIYLCYAFFCVQSQRANEEGTNKRADMQRFFIVLISRGKKNEARQIHDTLHTGRCAPDSVLYFIFQMLP